MSWLVALLLVVVVAGGAAWLRGLHTLAAVLVVPLFSLVFLVGRRIEAHRDADWSTGARAVQGSFRPGTPGDCDRFGRPAPWDTWAQDGQLQCPRIIEGRAAHAPFALVQVRYSVREARGEEHPDTWYEVTVAVVPLARAAPQGRLDTVDAGADYAGAHNGQSLFVWKKSSRGAGASLPARDWPGLLDEGRRLARAAGS
ncbi:hypothetical protein [Ramlibacter alkalitolerans]|jgi:hypothetical protein|uniref:DUF4131 domain-containing protein n=1 Tax=Ramlibacter alkalitolerans TaxID=2039631 RepID=A0ABS1JM70_9BURK|nr:hypothetical protein [Ramlibacter alkalitolerans]MBL0425344.1 hypothetical protein [Ramlibacter alkalitolerans]